MKELYKLKEMAMKELGEIVKEGEFTAGTLDAAQKLTDVVKNVDKIWLLEEEGEDDYSREGSYMRGRSRNGYSDDGESYARRGMHYVRGHYSRDGGSYDSYDGGSSGRRYSRDGEKDKVRGMLEEMMGGAENERQREGYRRMMEQLENM